jgi:hypothetical protein
MSNDEAGDGSRRGRCHYPISTERERPTHSFIVLYFRDLQHCIARGSVLFFAFHTFYGIHYGVISHITRHTVYGTLYNTQQHRDRNHKTIPHSFNSREEKEEDRQIGIDHRRQQAGDTRKDIWYIDGRATFGRVNNHVIKGIYW